MSFIVETKLPQPDLDDGEWYPVIDLQKSKIVPQVLLFQTRESAESWAEGHSVKGHEWRVVEYEVQ